MFHVLVPLQFRVKHDTQDPHSRLEVFGYHQTWYVWCRLSFALRVFGPP
jgi:hypothetical protein